MEEKSYLVALSGEKITRHLRSYLSADISIHNLHANGRNDSPARIAHSAITISFMLTTARSEYSLAAEFSYLYCHWILLEMLQRPLRQKERSITTVSRCRYEEKIASRTLQTHRRRKRNCVRR